MFKSIRGCVTTLNRKFSTKTTISETLSVLEEKISKISQLNDVQEYGKVISIGDGIAWVFGLNKV